MELEEEKMMRAVMGEERQMEIENERWPGFITIGGLLPRKRL